MILDLVQQAQGIQIRNNLPARRHAIQTLIRLGCGVVNGGFWGKDVDQRQIVASAHFVIVKVVCRGDFYAAGTEFTIHIVIGNYRNAPADQR